MAVRASRRTRHEDDEDTRDQWTETDDSDQRDSDDGWSPDRQMVRASERQPPEQRPGVPDEVFDPKPAIRVGLLRLARHWSDTGRIYQAIHAYTEVLRRYPGTGAAEAAAEELLIMADKLAYQGRFYAALNIFNKLEQLCC
jgi:tetratricopeptide (TPR) repeat protein